MAVTVGQQISFSYSGTTAYASLITSGAYPVAVGTLVITDGSAQGTYNNVTMMYAPNAISSLTGQTTGVYYIEADNHTFVNAINEYAQYDGAFTVVTLASSGSGGQTVTESVSFTTTVNLDTIVFQESGLPSGTSWSVTMNGQTLTSTTSSITFSGVPSGTYTFSVTASGYTANPSTGTVTAP